MNEIEYAIANISDFLEAEIGQGDLQMASVEMALAALQEQAERDKGCEYCSDMKYMPFGEHKVYIDGNGKLDVDDDEDFQLNFCPMCGKRLEEHHEAD